MAAVCALMFALVTPAVASTAPARQAGQANGAHALRLGGATRALSVGESHIAATSQSHNGRFALAASSTPNCATCDPPLLYRGGSVQHDPTFYAIFWLPSGYHYEPLIINGDSHYESLMARYLRDAGKTHLANVASQYYDRESCASASGTCDVNIQPASQYGGSWSDTTAFPEIPLSDANIRGAVTSALKANPTWKTGIDSTFFVFTPLNVGSCDTSLGIGCFGTTGGYCAYHSSFGSTSTIVYASMPEVEGANIPTGGEGCWSTNALPNGDIYADSEFTILAHEQWEAETDPTGGVGSTGPSTATRSPMSA